MNVTRRKKILMSLFLLSGIAVGFQNCDSGDLRSRTDTSINPDGNAYQDESSISCPSTESLTVSCKEGEILETVINKFGCEYEVCKSDDDTVYYCPPESSRPCDDGFTSEEQTDEYGCITYLCTPIELECSAEPFLCDLYMTHLNRFPDQSGAHYFMNRFHMRIGAEAQARETEAISNALRNSPEATGEMTEDESYLSSGYIDYMNQHNLSSARCEGDVTCRWIPPTCTADPFICSVYAEKLYRFPDQGGAEHYTNRINAATTPAEREAVKAQIIDDIGGSQEAQNLDSHVFGNTPMCAGNVSCPGITPLP